MNNKNRIDSESKWRKNLMDIASREKIILDDVYRIRASLRYAKNDRENKKITNFQEMTNDIIVFCEFLVMKYPQKINEKKDDSTQITDSIDREKVRIYCRYLLKVHWETYTNLDKKNKINVLEEAFIETKKLIDSLKTTENKTSKKNICSKSVALLKYLNKNK